MLEAVCHDISLVYDLSIKLNMQLANSKVDIGILILCACHYLVGSDPFSPLGYLFFCYLLLDLSPSGYL
jgi:hypothetical protein